MCIGWPPSWTLKELCIYVKTFGGKALKMLELWGKFSVVDKFKAVFVFSKCFRQSNHKHRNKLAFTQCIHFIIIIKVREYFFGCYVVF